MISLRQFYDGWPIEKFSGACEWGKNTLKKLVMVIGDNRKLGCRVTIRAEPLIVRFGLGMNQVKVDVNVTFQEKK